MGGLLIVCVILIIALIVFSTRHNEKAPWHGMFVKGADVNPSFNSEPTQDADLNNLTADTTAYLTIHPNKTEPLWLSMPNDSLRGVDYDDDTVFKYKLSRMPGCGQTSGSTGADQFKLTDYDPTPSYGYTDASMSI